MAANTNFAGAAASLALTVRKGGFATRSTVSVREDKQRIFRFAWGLACVSPLARNTNHPYRRTAVFLAALTAATLAPATARADDDCSTPWTAPACYKHADEGFYNDPPPPATPGEVIRSEPSRLVLEPSGIVPGWLADGTRIMYWSNTAGSPQ